MAFTLEIIVAGLAFLCDPLGPNCSEDVERERRILLVDAAPRCDGPEVPCIPQRESICGYELLRDHRADFAFDPETVNVHAYAAHFTSFLNDTSGTLALGPGHGGHPDGPTCLRLVVDEPTPPLPQPPPPQLNKALETLGLSSSKAYSEQPSSGRQLLNLRTLEPRIGALRTLEQRREGPSPLTGVELLFDPSATIASSRPTRYLPGHPKVGQAVDWAKLHPNPPPAQSRFDEQVVLVFPNIEWAHLEDCSDAANPRVLLSFGPPPWRHQGSPPSHRIVRASLVNHPLTGGGGGRALYDVLWYYRLFDFDGDACPDDVNLPVLAEQDISSRNGTSYCPSASDEDNP